jgi:hypothetical protein
MTREVKKIEQVEEVSPVVKQRPGKRSFSYSGPLTHIQNLEIPGYVLRIVSEKLNRNPYRVQELMKAEIGYEFVHPKEVNLKNLDGSVIAGDKIVVHLGNGQNGYLMKIPTEWANEDRKAKIKEALDGISGNSKVANSDASIKEISSTVTKQ